MSRYSIGIDLGTTNSAVSYFNLDEAKARGTAQTMLAIPQVTAVGTVEEKLLLPSFLYLPNDQEFPASSLALPWDKKRKDAVVGEFARSHGSKVPMRLVSSAKSWLCHPGVDRLSAILPWQAPEDVQRVSPLDAAARYLAHLREAWDHQFKDDKLAEQDVVLTVPASFDAAARDLTLKAAQQAGLPNITLIEEPQAAFYAWLEQMGEGFRKQVKPGDVVLVVDVGGGTTDFSLIAVTSKDGDVALTRVAVGDPILLGGDNMDLALAHTVNQRLAAEGKKLDAWQFNALTFACRQAKENMFADGKLKKSPLVVPGRGSSLVGGTIKAELSRDELTHVLTDGFFPKTAVTDMPQMARRTGLAQMALPYAQDAGITRHLAAFLRQHAATCFTALGNDTKENALPRPDAILFNGGVFNSPKISQRLIEIVSSWWPDRSEE